MGCVNAKDKEFRSFGHVHFNAHKLQKIVNMNVDISETIKDRELGTLTPTNRPNPKMGHGDGKL